MSELNNQELLELLKTDVKAFNDYREYYHNQIIDFYNANLERADLRGADLRGANL